MIIYRDVQPQQPRCLCRASDGTSYRCIARLDSVLITFGYFRTNDENHCTRIKESLIMSISHCDPEEVSILRAIAIYILVRQKVSFESALNILPPSFVYWYRFTVHVIFSHFRL